MYDLITLNDAELPDLISCQLVKSLKKSLRLIVITIW